MHPRSALILTLRAEVSAMSSHRRLVEGGRATGVVRVRTGTSVLADLGQALDELHEATSAPIMARRPWLESWIGSYPDIEPWVVSVEGPHGLEAAALLGRFRRRGVLHIVRMGHGATDHARLPARTPEAARHLAQTVSAELKAIRGPWHLFLGQLPVGDMVARNIAAELPTAVFMSGDGAPTVRFDRGRLIDSYVPRKLRNNLRTRMNRLNREGLPADFARLRMVADVERVLPETERVRRDRDDALGRKTKLDDPRYLAFRRRVLSELATRHEVEITTFRIRGELVAYQVGLLDGGVYRQWDSRFSSAWGRFAPGSQLNAATLGWVLEDTRFHEFDFMRGIHPHKLEFATEVIPAETLMAWSSSIVRRYTGVEERLKRLVKGTRESPSDGPGTTVAKPAHAAQI